MKFNITKEDGSKGSSINVDDSVFGIEPNNSVVHQAVVAELANGRQRTQRKSDCGTTTCKRHGQGWRTGLESALTLIGR